MDNLRFVLFILLIFLGVMMWQQWQLDYGPKPETDATAKLDVPPTTNGMGTPVTKPLPTDPEDTPVMSAIRHQRISVTTDVVRMEIDSEGGDIRQLDLLHYPEDKDKPDQLVRLFADDKDYFVAQSGFLGDGASAPSHHTQWQTAATEYTLANGQNSLRIPLTWSNGQGLKIVKTYVLERGSYKIGMEQQVENQGQETWRGRQYVQLQRKDPGDKNKNQFIRTFTGGVLYTPETKYEKISFGDMADKNLSAKSEQGWVAMIQHYFLAAWIPASGQENNFYTKSLPDAHYVIGSYSAPQSVPVEESKTFKTELFAGPKLQRILEETAPGLELTVDYGNLTVAAKPIFWLLEKFHSLSNNWGVAIILVTLTLKALFFRLSASSYKSMANMRKLQPKLAELKERYGANKQEFNMKMMELYRKEKVNPLGGCLPILVQIPVFIALYWVLIETVEMRQAPFFLWINDLSSKDPYFILPGLMVISMYFQQKLSPPPSDPMQAKVMQFFPFIFGVMFLFFPSGLVLYWVVNNLLSIAQQWYINRMIEKTA